MKFSRFFGVRVRNIGRLAAVLLPLAAGACREADLTGPKSSADASPPCTTSDCAAFRQLTPTTVAPLLEATSRTATLSLQNKALGQRIASRVADLQASIEASKKADAQITLLGILLEIDGAMSDSGNSADLADLSSMRINLEPVIIYLGLR